MGERLPCTEEVRGSNPLISMGGGLTKPREGGILFFAHKKAREMIKVYEDV